jgi:hypothetical protein
MFTRFNRCNIDLRYVDADGELIAFNPWDHLPHSSLTMSRESLEWFLAFLREVHGLELYGVVKLWEGQRTQLLAIQASRVLD